MMRIFPSLVSDTNAMELKKEQTAAITLGLVRLRSDGLCSMRTILEELDQ